jgi:opacity protein-like surface antigen
MKALFFLLFLSLNLHALEVDEKLTTRILKTSESRKTVMINRGTEDGLVEGDHAKFIVTAGIVARGVCVKVSPTRSVWSIYRLVNADFITNDAVMSLKITPPVKVTKDSSQTLVQEDTPTKVSTEDPESLGIPLAEGAQDLNSETTTGVDQDDLKSLQDETQVTLQEKMFEVFGFLNVNGLTASTKTDSSDSFANSQASQYIGLGGEIYPQREREWYSRFSFEGHVAVSKADSQAYNGSSSTNDVTEFGGALNWYPMARPSEVMTFIPYLHAGLHMGTVKSTFKPGQGVAGSETSANGSTSGFSLGLGYKFYTSKGFGARAILDYYYRSEKYKEDEAALQFTKSVGGPRFMVGLSYRF